MSVSTGSTAVLRVWCSLFLSMLGVAAFLIFKNYKVVLYVLTKFELSLT